MVEPNLSDTCIDVFEEDEEDEESYLFAGHGICPINTSNKINEIFRSSKNVLLFIILNIEEEDEVDVEINLDDEDNDAPDVLDPYDIVYANVPSETHKLEAVENCEHCNAKKFE